MSVNAFHQYMSTFELLPTVPVPQDDAQKEMDSKIVPVVLGYRNEIYPLDHHHVMAALDYSGYDKVTGIMASLHCGMMHAYARDDTFFLCTFVIAALGVRRPN